MKKKVEQPEQPQPTITELMERINSAVKTLNGEVSLTRRDSVISHLAAVASNLEAEIPGK